MRFPKRSNEDHQISVGHSRRQHFVRPEEGPDRTNLSETGARMTRENARPFSFDFNDEHSSSHAMPENRRAVNRTSPNCVYLG